MLHSCGLNARKVFLNKKKRAVSLRDSPLWLLAIRRGKPFEY
jgi:hypothetical protein